MSFLLSNYLELCDGVFIDGVDKKQDFEGALEPWYEVFQNSIKPSGGPLPNGRDWRSSSCEKPQALEERGRRD